MCLFNLISELHTKILDFNICKINILTESILMKKQIEVSGAKFDKVKSKKELGLLEVSLGMWMADHLGGQGEKGAYIHQALVLRRLSLCASLHRPSCTNLKRNSVSLSGCSLSDIGNHSGIGY